MSDPNPVGGGISMCQCVCAELTDVPACFYFPFLWFQQKATQAIAAWRNITDKSDDSVHAASSLFGVFTLVLPELLSLRPK